MFMRVFDAQNKKGRQAKSGCEGCSFKSRPWGSRRTKWCVRSTRRDWGVSLWRQREPDKNDIRRWGEKPHDEKLNQKKAGTVCDDCHKAGLLLRQSVLSRAALPGLTLSPLACGQTVPRASVFVGGNHLSKQQMGKYA
jgi:hypothetical protein